MPEQPELPLPLELTKTSFQTEVLRAARINPNSELLNLLETGRRNLLKSLTVTKPTRGVLDLLHLFTLAQLLQARSIYDAQLKILNSLATFHEEEDERDFVTKVLHWNNEASSLLNALESLRKVDLGMFREIISNL
jgi:hypothetical protein